MIPPGGRAGMPWGERSGGYPDTREDDGEASEGARGTGAIADEAVVEDDVEIRLAVGSAGNESQSGEAEQERAMHHIRLH